ncbi:MAG: dnaQ [Gemmatimonadetes bacterium]|nr:dnaQ [Gemmatimonadota bacterium]
MGGVRFEHEGSLSNRAMRVLMASPLPTAEVALKVLGLRGDGGAAAVAVFTLLGRDPRFVVSGDGVWSVASQPAVDVRRLREEEFVVVDVETTGGSPGTGDRVTEIAAVRVSRGIVTESFSSLVNPERPIPSAIVHLTGITHEMVRGAPTFREIAHQVEAMVQGNVFVAHNAAFDWSFITAEMERAMGSTPRGRTLCTVRLARKLLPELPSRALGALAEYFGVEIESHHRALDDAAATARVLLRLVDMLEEHDVEDWSALEWFMKQRATAPGSSKRRASPRSMRSA